MGESGERSARWAGTWEAPEGADRGLCEIEIGTTHV